MSIWYLLVVTVGLLGAQTHDWVLWGSITEAGSALTPPAVSRVGIKIWHPQRSSVDTSWAWSQRKCLSPPLSTQPFALLHNHKPLFPPSPPYISSFYFIHPVFFPQPPLTLSNAFLFRFSPSSSLNPPSLLPLVLPPPTCKSFPVTQHWFSANFSSLLEHQSVAQ